MDKTYSGAGVIVFEEYLTNDKKIIPTILLTRNKSSKLYTDFGGFHDKKHKNLKDTASKELLEESRCLIEIDEKHFSEKNSFDILGNIKRKIYYKVFVIKINGICRKHYHHNRKIIDNDKNSKRYLKETDDITHIPIKNLEFSKKQKKVYDIYNKEINLSLRLRNILDNIDIDYDKVKLIKTKNSKINKMYKIKS